VLPRAVTEAAARLERGARDIKSVMAEVYAAIREMKTMCEVPCE
jgi:hypothetical protein